MVGDVMAGGAALTFTGSVIAFRQPKGRRNTTGDSLALFGLAVWFGGPLWWLFYQ